MSERPESPRAAGGKGCGCFAALAFLIAVGLPVLFVFSFGLSPCKDGPCDPNGERNLLVALGTVAALAALIGLAVWQLARRNALGWVLWTGGGLLLLAGAALLGLILF